MLNFLSTRWKLTSSQTYDTDGNILQAIDSQEMPTLLSALFSDLASSVTNDFTIIDFGCGTGRNTSALLASHLTPPGTKIHAMDPSPAMLSLAQSRCTTNIANNLAFHLLPPLPTPTSPLTLPIRAHSANIMVSTLVLEHCYIEQFFAMCADALNEATDSYLLISNMHDEMGRRSQAGFLDENGRKIQGTSFVYSLADVVREAGKVGFEVLGRGRERVVIEGDIAVLGHRAKKWIGCGVWFGVVLKRVGRC
jgi:SAM-dependent methyltransferase